MQKFLILYGANEKILDQWNNQSPDEGEEDMQKWMKWMDENTQYLVDSGNPVGKNTRIHSNGTAKIMPNELCGYLILQADDRDHAIEILKSNPHLDTSDVYIELMNIMDIEM